MSLPHLSNEPTVGSGASGTGSTKRRSKFHHLEGRKDGNIAVGLLYPQKGNLIFCWIRLASGLGSAPSGPHPECGCRHIQSGGLIQGVGHVPHTAAAADCSVHTMGGGSIGWTGVVVYLKWVVAYIKTEQIFL